MWRWIALLFVVGCSAEKADPCRDAYSHVVGLGAFGGQGYAGDIALAWGMSCDDFTHDDLACLDRAASPSDVDACTHARTVFRARSDAFEHDGNGTGDADEAAMGKVADAACRCKDLRCLVGVGEQQRERLSQLLAGPMPTESSLAAKRVGDCLWALESPSPQRSNR
jgi:hypothetical protein